MKLKQAVEQLKLKEEEKIKIAQLLFLLDSLPGVTSATAEILDNLRIVLDKVQDNEKYIALKVLNDLSEEVDEILVDREIIKHFSNKKAA